MNPLRKSWKRGSVSIQVLIGMLGMLGCSHVSYTLVKRVHFVYSPTNMYVTPHITCVNALTVHDGIQEK